MVSSTRAGLLLSLSVFAHLGHAQWLDYTTVAASPELKQELELFWSYGRSPPVYPTRTFVFVPHHQPLSLLTN